jgi:hypothetical protein
LIWFIPCNVSFGHDDPVWYFRVCKKAELFYIFRKWKSGLAIVINTDMLSQVGFLSLTNIIIDNFEGGYYHPDMVKKNETRRSGIAGSIRRNYVWPGQNGCAAG